MGVIKPAALASLDPANRRVGGTGGFERAPFATLSGVQNVAEPRPAGDPVTFAGPGAGARDGRHTLDDIADVLGA